MNANTSSAVLDASAVLTYLCREPGWEVIEPYLGNNSIISAVSVAEIVAHLSDKGIAPEVIGKALNLLRLQTVALDAELAVAVGLLRQAVRHLDLSLGGCACLALAYRRGLSAVTTDNSWQHLGIGVDVRLLTEGQLAEAS